MSIGQFLKIVPINILMYEYFKFFKLKRYVEYYLMFLRKSHLHGLFDFYDLIEILLFLCSFNKHEIFKLIAINCIDDPYIMFEKNSVILFHFLTKKRS